MPDLSSRGLRETADEVETVWTDYVDEVVIDAARAATAALRRLADTIEGDRTTPAPEPAPHP